MLFVNADAVLPGPAVVLPVGPAFQQRTAGGFSFSLGNVNGVCILLDEVKGLRYRFEGKQLLSQGLHHLGFVHVFPDQRTKRSKISVHDLWIAGVAALFQRLAGGLNIDFL